MSYYVTITRRPSPHWERGAEIALDEWRAAALAEPGFRAPTDGERAGAAPYARPADLVWAGHPAHAAVWFAWHEGQVDVKGPDAATLRVMARLAARLGARLLGEGGERFDAAGASLGLADFPEEPRATGTTPWWRRLFRGGRTRGA